LGNHSRLSIGRFSDIDIIAVDKATNGIVLDLDLVVWIVLSRSQLSLQADQGGY
jgi:hypothetical protein